MKHKRGFASDNNSGIHPDILKSIERANSGHVIAYGDDIYTRRAILKIKEHFGKDVEVFFVLTGTAANVLGLTVSTNTFNSIICAETAHINVDECGGPENFSGCKVIPVETPDGKINIGSLKKHVRGFGFEHHSQPKIISISQPTELGTVYSPDEINELGKYAHKYNMLLHMDGARLSNAVVSLGVEFKDITADAGVDILSFGGTKNGMLFGESVIFFNRKLAENFKYIRKQGMQLASKMRFISAQFETYLTNDLWKKNAVYANNMAQLLYRELSELKQIKITQKVQSNSVFAVLPGKYIKKLQDEYFFYVWDEGKSEVRFMTSFDTTEEDIYTFTQFIRQTVK
ncbi:MAG: low specificity L-threonine aldolase [Bacteroidales bacterium]|nr:MAG: low specificity L-threonine aldolase [Bacteroidales bacterium]